MPLPIALLVAGAFAAGAGIYGGVQAASDEDEETSGTDRSLGTPQPGSTRTDNQGTAAIFEQKNQPGRPGGMTAQQAQQQAQSGFTTTGDLMAEVNGMVGGGISMDQFAGAGGFVDQSGEGTVAIADLDADSPFAGISSPGDLSEEDQNLLQLLTGQDPWSMDPQEQEAWMAQVQGREFPRDGVANTLFALEDRPDQLVTLQQKLFATGNYGPAAYEDIRWGTIGPETIDAFDKFLAFASRHQTSQGQKLSWQTLLDRLVEAEGGLREALEGTVEDEQPTVSINLSDPNAIVQTLDAVWQRNTGRKAPDEAKRRFVAVMHGLQRNAQTTSQIGQQTPGAVTEVSQPNAEARAQALVDTEAPDESLAFQSLQAYQGLLQKIGGR